MRASEIIRSVLDLIDQIDCEQQQQLEPVASATIVTSQETQGPDHRFNQILDILMHKNASQMYDNTPNETIAGINSVTTDAGVQGVHPADIRSDSAAMYPHLSVRN
jgi:hypothetical protein